MHNQHQKQDGEGIAMSNSPEKKISQSHFFFILIQSQIGVAVLSLPYSVHQTAEGDGWISTLLAGFVVQLWMFAFLVLVRFFPERNLFGFSPQLLGKWIGRFVSFLYIIYFLLIASLVAVLQANLITGWILTLTPFWIIYMLIIITGVLLARENIQVIARFFSITSVIIFIFITLTSSVFTFMDIDYILPIGHSGVSNIFKAIRNVVLALTGFEILLIIYPLLNNKRKTIKTLTIANITVTSIYTLLVFSSLVVFSSEEIKLVPQPVLYMLKAISFEVIERLDLIFLSIWIFPMTNSFIIYIYKASKGLQQLFHTNTHAPFVPIVVVPILISAFFLQNQFIVEKVGKFSENFIYLFVFLFPLLFLLLAFVKKKMKKRGKKNEMFS